MKKNRNVGIIGVGQSVYSSHREEVNQPEMIREAVVEALNHAGITMADVDCVVHGNMELFEMIHQPDLWHVLGTGAYGKETLRVTTGGTTGATLVCVADNLVASGLHDVVMAIGFEKLQEGHTTGGITNMADPLWSRQLQTGALTGMTAADMIQEFGAERAKRASLRYRVHMDKHAMLNKKAHRRFGLDFDQIDNLAATSPPLVGELRLIHMCSQSDGACVMIFASEEKAKKFHRQPAWIKDHITVHREEYFCIFGLEKYVPTHRYAAEQLYRRNNIKNPRKEIDMFEMYDPSSWWGLDWLRDFLLLEGDEHLKMVENDEIAINGSFPVNPSGGVTASNPIGATAMARVAEAALQIMGEAGDHQVPKTVKQALASGFGGTMWTVLFLLTRDVPGSKAAKAVKKTVKKAAKTVAKKKAVKKVKTVKKVKAAKKVKAVKKTVKKVAKTAARKKTVRTVKKKTVKVAKKGKAVVKKAVKKAARKKTVKTAKKTVKKAAKTTAKKTVKSAKTVKSGKAVKTSDKKRQSKKNRK